MSNTKYPVKKTVFFHWYMRTQSKENITNFLSPHIHGLPYKDASFSLEDILEYVGNVPANLITNGWTGKDDVLINYKNIKLIKG